MTDRFAELEAIRKGGSLASVMTATARDDSATYPRPTPVAQFLEPPFNHMAAEIDEALVAIGNDQSSQDVQLVTASDGTRFLYSTGFLDAARAGWLAEWMAVGRMNHP